MTAAPRRTRRVEVRPVGPASLDSSAKVSTRPLESVTMPTSELVPVNDPVLARSHPADARPASVSRKRFDSVPLPPAIGSRSTSGRSVGLSGPAAALTVSSSVSAVSRSSTDRPLQSTRYEPPVSILAESNSPRTARTEPSKLCGFPCAAATSRPIDFGHHVVGVVHHLPQPLEQGRRLHRRDLVAVERRRQHCDGGRVDAQRHGERRARRRAPGWWNGATRR